MKQVEEAIRRVEMEVLDQHHKQFTLLLRSEELAIHHVLTMYGDALRHYERVKGEGATFRRQRYVINSFTHGLSHCLRWIAAEPQRTVLLPDASTEELDREAKELLLWAAQYETLAGDHTAWSRKLVTAEIDEGARLIVFSHPEQVNAALFVRQTEAHQALVDAAEYPVPVSALQEDFLHWIASTQFDSDGVHLPWRAQERQGILHIVHQWLDEAVWREVPSQIDLEGFTLADVRRVLAFLYTFCLYNTWLVDSFDQMARNSGLFRAEPLRETRDGFVTWIADMSAVSREAVAEIVDLLTLDTGNFHAKIPNQPLVRSRSGTIFLLPRLFTGINLCRMLGGAFNKGSRRAVYDRLGEHFEQVSLDMIESSLRNRTPFEIAREEDLHGPDGELLTPDFLVHDSNTNALLVIDYKHVLSPYSTADVDYKVRDYEEWRQKLRQYCDFAKANPCELTRHLPSLSSSCPPSVNGMILTRYPLPIPIELDGDMCIADWASLNRHLNQRSLAVLGGLVEWALSRPDVQTPTSLRYDSKDFKVGDWTYRRKTLMTDDEEAPAENRVTAQAR